MQRATEIVLALTLIGVTLAFGGVQPVAYSLMEIMILALFLAWLIYQARQGQIHLALPVWPVLFAVLVLAEIVPLPAGFVTALDPERRLRPSLLGIEHITGRAMTLSVYPHATVLELMKFLAYLAAFALAVSVFDSRRRKSTLVRVLIFLGLFEAVYGTIQYLTGWQQIFTYKKVAYVDSATGTFINHNHYAGFIELTFPFMLASAFYYFQIWQDAHRKGPSRIDPATASAAGVQTLLYAFLSIVAVVAVVFSRSRGGILSTLFTIVFVGLLAQLKTKRKVWMLGLAIFVLISVAYGLWVGLNPILSRFEELTGGTQSLMAEGRIPTWESTLGIIRQHPLTGIGLGAFRYGFPHFQTYTVNLYFTHAHNDYLEFVADTGWPGGLLLFVPIFVLLFIMIRSFTTDTRRYRPAVTLGCIGSVLALLIHSVVDFNLHIPANALTFAVVLGIGYKAACVERKEERTKASVSHPAVSGRVARNPSVN